MPRRAPAGKPGGMILVIGATGNVGRHVVSRLVRQGVAVRCLVRDPSRARLPAAAQVLVGDLADPESVRAAAAGAEAAFMVWPFPTAEAAPAVLDAISDRVRRIVYLSSLGVRDDAAQQVSGINQMHADMEKLIESRVPAWTFLRPSGFATNTISLFAAQIRARGQVRWPYGAAARSLIDERDIADVAALALTEDGHTGARYLLTGPQQVSQREQVRLIGDAIGRPVSYLEIPPDAARQRMIADGWPASFADDVLTALAGWVRQPEPLTTIVATLTGRSAHTFAQWAHHHAADFTPATPEQNVQV